MASGETARLIVSGVMSFFLNLVGFVAARDPTYVAYAAIAPPLKTFVVSLTSRIPSFNIWILHVDMSQIAALIPASMFLFGLTLVVVSTLLFAGFSVGGKVVGPLVAFGLGVLVVLVFWLGFPISLASLIPKTPTLGGG